MGSRLIVLLLCAFAVLGGADRETLTVLTVNDVYLMRPANGWGGLAELKTLLDRESQFASHTLVTVNGDFLSPSLLSAETKGAHMVDLLGSLDVDLVVVGNHEFDFGRDVLRRRMHESRFAWLGSNVMEKGDRVMQGLYPYGYKQVGAFMIGFFGVVLPATAQISQPGPDLTFLDPVIVSRQMVEILQKGGADVIIAVTHQPVAQDRLLLEEIEGIDLVLGGHEHRPITDEVRGKLIHKSGHDAHYLGRIDLMLERDDKGEVSLIPAWQMIPNYLTPANPAVTAKIAKYEKVIQTLKRQRVAATNTQLVTAREEALRRELALSNYTADTVREVLGAEVALLNGGLIDGQKVYPEGAILTKGDILTIFPYAESPVVVEVLGSDLQEALEIGFARYPKASTAFPVVSGMEVVFDPQREPMDRVMMVEVDGQPLDYEKLYRVATTTHALEKGRGDTQGRPDRTVADLLIEEWDRQEEITPKLDGRVRAAQP